MAWAPSIVARPIIFLRIGDQVDDVRRPIWRPAARTGTATRDAVALASGGKHAYSSKDGAEWKAWPKAIPCKVLCVHNGVFVGTSWPGQMWFSKDGLEWKKCDPLPPNGINAAVFGPLKK